METRCVEFNEALIVLARRLRDGALSISEFRQQRRQLLVALMTPPVAASEAGPGFEVPAEPPPVVPAIEKAEPRRGMLAAVLLLAALLALVLFGTLA